VADALGRLSAYDRKVEGWRRDLARLYLPLSVGAAAAVIAAFLWLPKTAIPQADGPTVDAYGLAPNDPLGAAMMSSEDAPTMAVLLATRISERAP